MPGARKIAVIDIGKTNAKVALVDLVSLKEVAVHQTPNRVIDAQPYPHYDIEALWSFIIASLAALQSEHGIGAITVTTHGASAVLLDAGGELAAPVLDYEHDGPDQLAAEYDNVRPGFEETGSPRLPMGLNLGAQLYWQFASFPEIRERTAKILTYPQYWAYRLSGVVSTETTSLGCHTDLWNPNGKTFSSLVDKCGWAELMAPVHKAVDRLGMITNEIAVLTGLSPETPVICGIHDSNASLYPYLASRQPPFSVVSTGTWVICMAIGGSNVRLDPSRDTLINVNAFGDPVPSARFMGGREFEVAMRGRAAECSADDMLAVVAKRAMLLPAVESRSGPFQGCRHRWTVAEEDLMPGERHAVLSFYLAMMTATCLDIIGADGAAIIEGPFASNDAYRRMLAAATGRSVIPAAGGTGTSAGSALLCEPRQFGPLQSEIHPVDAPEGFGAYAKEWQETAAGQVQPGRRK
ncbi:FGGY-family carbohydrate kinase [Hoeflea sp.]|uniref:FGGY-family carbohydrate kinase n=1 Tax=Hoeflea sp. TaxID=1940281 RepID=UPI003BAE609A